MRYAQGFSLWKNKKKNSSSIEYTVFLRVIGEKDSCIYSILYYN